jgi:DNA polymerase (family 10)
MSIHNAEIAAMFNELADLLELDGANEFRVRACGNAARVVGGLSQSAADIIAKGEELSELPGIGKDLAGKITDIVATCPDRAEVMERLVKAEEVREVLSQG